MDNTFLKSELKSSKNDIELVHKRWQYALVLVGLALLHDNKRRNRNGDASSARQADGDGEEEVNETIDQRIEAMTTALAPVLLPMIESLGALDLEASVGFESSAETA